MMPIYSAIHINYIYIIYILQIVQSPTTQVAKVNYYIYQYDTNENDYKKLGEIRRD